MTSKTGSRLGTNCPIETSENTDYGKGHMGNDFGSNLVEKSSCCRYFWLSRKRTEFKYRHW